MLTQADLRAVGNNQSPKLWFSDTLPTGTNPSSKTILAPSRADLSMPSTGILITADFRATVATAAYSAVNAELYQNIIKKIIQSGVNQRTSSASAWNGSGANLFALNNAFKLGQSKGGVMYVNSTRQARLSSPMAGTPSDSTPFASTPATGSDDVRIAYWIPFAPFGSTPLIEQLYAQRDEDWQRTMNLEIDIPDFSGTTDPFGTKGSSGTIEFTAYGSGSGSGSIKVYLVPHLGNDLASKIVPGFVQRIFNSYSLTTTENGKLLRLLRNVPTNMVVLKSGVVTTSGDYSSLSDSIFTNLYITSGGKPVIQTNDYYSAKMDAEDRIDGEIPQGYNLKTWIGAGASKQNAAAYFQDKGWATNPAKQFEVSADVTGASNQQGEIMQETIELQPQIV